MGKIIYGALCVGVVLLGGCTTSPLIDAEALPEGFSLLRCTDYDAAVNGTFAMANAEGFQCLHSGDALRGSIVVETDEFKVEILPQAEVGPAQ